MRNPPFLARDGSGFKGELLVLRPAVTTWSLWRQPRRVVILILIVEISAVALPALLTARADESDLGLAVLLASLSIAYSVSTRRWERARRALREGMNPSLCPNLLAAWGLAAALLLPLSLAFAVLVAASIAEWPARKITGQATPYRHVYSGASTVLAAVAARQCLDLDLPRQVSYVAAAVAYTLVCVVIIGVAVAASGQFGALRVYARASSYRLDALTGLIALTQVEVHDLHFPVLWLSLPLTIGLQRRTVKADLHSAADETTAKPMSEEAWLIASQEIIAALDVAAIIRINSAAPAAVAELARLQAGCDAIGYAGTTGLAMLLIDCPELSADALASRLRTVLHTRGIDASIAAAAKPRDGYCLDDLLAVCEAELIAREAASRSANSPRPEA